MASDLSKGILHSDPAILQEYTKEFQNCLEHSSPLLQQSKNLDEALQLYMTSFDTIQDLTSLDATPCDSDFMDNEYFFDRVKEHSPKYAPLTKAYGTFLNVLKQVNRKDFLPSVAFRSTVNLESHQVPVVLSFLNFHLKRESPLLNIFWNIFRMKRTIC